jgi:hypothetical protein
MNIALTPDGRASINLDALIGSFRSFGISGPVYEVIGLAPVNGEVKIRVVESGEELAYPVAELLDDPVAR